MFQAWPAVLFFSVGHRCRRKSTLISFWRRQGSWIYWYCPGLPVGVSWVLVHLSISLYPYTAKNANWCCRCSSKGSYPFFTSLSGCQVCWMLWSSIMTNDARGLVVHYASYCYCTWVVWITKSKADAIKRDCLQHRQGYIGPIAVGSFKMFNVETLKCLYPYRQCYYWLLLWFETPSIVCRFCLHFSPWLFIKQVESWRTVLEGWPPAIYSPRLVSSIGAERRKHTGPIFASTKGSWVYCSGWPFERYLTFFSGSFFGICTLSRQINAAATRTVVRNK